MSSEIPFDLPENLVVMAGAGAGKTHALITIALHLLAGARQERVPLPAAQLTALTFTEKAAAEMKARLRRRVAALADGARLEDAEPELAASFVRLGHAAPSADSFSHLLDEVPLAFVGTFHALCAQLLRRWALKVGVAAEFTLTDEQDASSRLERAIEATLLDALESEGERAEHAKRLIRALQFVGEGDALGAREYLARVHSKLAEEGREAGSLASDLPTETALQGEVTQATRSAELAFDALAPHRSAPALQPVFQKADEIREALGRGTVSLEGLRRAASVIKLNLGPRPAKEAQRQWKEALEVLRGAKAALDELALDRSFIAMLGESERRFDEGKRRDGVLDFADLLSRTCSLLRDHLDVRAEVQSRMGALLVDEFQDTNPLQLELVCLVAEARSDGPRPLLATQRAFAELPLEPRFLAAVGDRKQSIYEFRGAEVSLLTSLADRLPSRGEGRVVHLRSNWRSAPPLITLFNHLFVRAMAGPSGEPFEVRYHATDDDLIAQRDLSVRGPCAELIAIDREEGENSDSLRWR